jgi:hypothetical protein
MVARYKPSDPNFARAAADRMAAISRSAEMNPHLLREIPRGGDVLGVGAEAIAFRSPQGGVVRVGGSMPDLPGRPVSPSVLPAARTVDFPKSRLSTVRAEHTPMAANVDDYAYWHGGTGTPAPNSRMNQLGRRAQAEGLEFMDRHAGNVGTFRGRDVVIDPGAVDVDIAGTFADRFAPVSRAGQDGGALGRLYGSLGGDLLTRRALARGQASPALSLPGGLAGALLGGGGYSVGRAPWPT